MIEKNRILLKISGEALLGDSQFGLNIKTITYIANEIKEVYKDNYQICLIIGGGNIGFNLAKNIEKDFEEVRLKIIEKNKERAEFLANELSKTIVINGNGLDEDILAEVNLENFLVNSFNLIFAIGQFLSISISNNLILLFENGKLSKAPGDSNFLWIDLAISNSCEIITSIGKFSLL